MKIFITRPSVLIFTFALGVAAVFGIYSILSKNVETVAAPRIYTSERGEDIAAIYSDILKGEGYRVSEVLISDRTRSDDVFEEMVDKGWGGSADMLASYRANNAKRIPINEFLADWPQAAFWTKEMSEATFKINPVVGWKIFHEQHPGLKGFVTFSGVGFNATGDRALVFFTYSCGPLCATGTYFDMRKAADGTWYVAYKTDLWAA